MIIGIYGHPVAGKTKVVEQLIGSLVKKGYRVSSVKHTPHEKSLDVEGKETWRHWKAGSDPVVFASRTETGLIKHSETSAEEIARLVLRDYRPDVLIFQGFEDGSFPKVAFGKAAPRKGTVLANPRLSQPVRYIEKEVALEKVLADLPGLDCGKCSFDCRGLAGEVVKGRLSLSACKELSDLNVRIFVDGERLPAGKFVSTVVHKTVHGMLSSLKGYQAGQTVEIRLTAAKSNAGRGTTRG